jgi:TonB family protein
LKDSVFLEKNKDYRMKIRELIVEKSTTISEAPRRDGFLAGLERGLANPYDTLFKGNNKDDTLFKGDNKDDVSPNTKLKPVSDTPSLSSAYTEKIKASVMSNVAEQPNAGPVSVQIKSRPDGMILKKQLIRSSGDPDWDNAILQGIDKTEKLPTDIDGRTPTTMVVKF